MDRKSEAVLATVSVIAAACGQSEEAMAKWLELYHTVRCASEAEPSEKTPSVGCADTSLGEGGKGAGKTSDSSLGEGGKGAGKTSDSSLGEGGKGAGKKKPSRIGAPGNRNAADAAAFKRAVRERYLEARRAGLTTGKVLEMANGAITDGNLLDIGEARVVSINVYRVLAAVLDKLED